MRYLGRLLGVLLMYVSLFFFSSRRRHTRLQGDWSSDVCSSDLVALEQDGRSVPGSLALRRKVADRLVFSKLRTRLGGDRKSTRLNSSHLVISYAVFCLKKKKKKTQYLSPSR